LSLAWPYFSVRGVLVGGGQQEVSALLQEFAGGGDAEATHSLHQFYRLDPLLHALGLALLGLPIALYLLVRREHFFISLGAAAMLLPFVVNAYRPLPLGHRFILLAVFFLQVGVVWLLLKLSRGSREAWTALTAGRRGWAAGVLIAAVLLTTSWWNVTAARDRLESSNRRLRGMDSPNIRYSRRIAELAGADSVVLGDAQSSWPVPTFGPKVVVLWHGNPLVLDEAERRARVKQFFHPRTADSTRLEIIRQYGVTHVLVKRRLAARVQRFLARTSTRNALPAGYSLYTLQVTTPAG
ncbi:MAG TPA: hypothetical protein VER33_19350, partial [Polyangiaceae bacterium]|nr:hypothetical protein [Polyangiaceae bacterium]